MHQPGRSPRESTPHAVVARALLWLAVVLAARTAAAQRIANQFDDGAANATQGPITVGQPGGSNAIIPQRMVPHMPQAISRPDNWPGRKRDGKKTDNHVLSSIRPDPDAPIAPGSTRSFRSSAQGAAAISG